jgi:DNA recombination protein RmuC
VDGELLEFGVQNNVILATPTTLIALLKAVAYGWKQEQLARNAQEIRKLGAELYDRVRVFANHYEDVGKSLRGAVQSYDKGRTSLETRLLATARKFEELGVAQAGALPQPLPFTGSLGFGIDDEGRGNTGGSGEAAAAGSA